jgi:hypothetical protein
MKILDKKKLMKKFAFFRKPYFRFVSAGHKSKRHPVQDIESVCNKKNNLSNSASNAIAPFLWQVIKTSNRAKLSVLQASLHLERVKTAQSTRKIHWLKFIARSPF